MHGFGGCVFGDGGIDIRTIGGFRKVEGEVDIVAILEVGEGGGVCQKNFQFLFVHRNFRSAVFGGDLDHFVEHQHFGVLTFFVEEEDDEENDNDSQPDADAYHQARGDFFLRCVLVGKVFDLACG